jgi:hypothetical protein
MGHMKDLDRRIRQGGDDAIAAVGELLPSWIPVSERLPEEDVDVLVMTGYGMHVADLDEYGTWNASHGDSWQFPEPTHWMPLPEPPETTS